MEYYSIRVSSGRVGKYDIEIWKKNNKMPQINDALQYFILQNCINLEIRFVFLTNMKKLGHCLFCYCLVLFAFFYAFWD